MRTVVYVYDTNILNLQFKFYDYTWFIGSGFHLWKKNIHTRLIQTRHSWAHRYFMYICYTKNKQGIIKIKVLFIFYLVLLFSVSYSKFSNFKFFFSFFLNQFDKQFNICRH